MSPFGFHVLTCLHCRAGRYCSLGERLYFQSGLKRAVLRLGDRIERMTKDREA